MPLSAACWGYSITISFEVLFPFKTPFDFYHIEDVMCIMYKETLNLQYMAPLNTQVKTAPSTRERIKIKFQCAHTFVKVL